MKKKFNPFTGNFDLVPFETYSRAYDPTATCDASQGYAVGDEWTNTVTKGVFKCVDNTTGAAVWFNFVNADAQDKNLVVPFTNQTSVVIDHNFGKYPSVEVMDTTGETIEVEIIQNSVNRCSVNLNMATSGTIILN